RAVIEMKINEFIQLFIKGKEGNIYVNAAELAVLSVSTTTIPKIGLMFHECERAAREIAEIMKRMD
ncbi:MAG: roadblock/LC7 domain-containing protein, partial [Promethearchaeota archaeon]